MDKGKGTIEHHSKRPKTVPIVVNFEGSINFLFLFFKNFYVEEKYPCCINIFLK